MIDSFCFSLGFKNRTKKIEKKFKKSRRVFLDEKQCTLVPHKNRTSAWITRVIAWRVRHTRVWKIQGTLLF